MKPEPLPVRIFAHRGASGYAPENTLEAFSKALEMGAKGIELDVHFIVGQLLVYHDEEKAAQHRQNNIHIPLLEEALNLIDRRAVVNIELKDAESAKPVVEMIRHYVYTKGWSYTLFVVSSFAHDSLREVRRLGAEIPIALLIRDFKEEYLATAGELQACSLNTARSVTTVDIIEKAHGQDLKFYVYRVNDIAEMHKYENWGVDGIFSDFPDIGG